MLLRARRAVQGAIRTWNNKANWKWLQKTTEAISVAPGVQDYPLPSDLKSVYQVRMEGSWPRTLDHISRRIRQRLSPNQTLQNRPTVYDLFSSRGSAGYIRLVDIPTTAETMYIDYYRYMTIPTNVELTDATLSVASRIGDYALITINVPTVSGMTIGSEIDSFIPGTPPDEDVIGPIHNDVITTITSPTQIRVQYGWNDGTFDSIDGLTVRVGGSGTMLDVPIDYEDSILAWAKYLFLIDKSSGGPRLQYWTAEAQRTLEDALKLNIDDAADEQLAFIPGYVFDSVALGPNDIRWADRAW